MRYDDNVYTHIAVILGKEPLEEERWITMKEKYFGERMMTTTLI